MFDAYGHSSTRVRSPSHLRFPNSDVYRSYVKRLLDLVIGVLATPIVVPLIGLLWIAVRLDGGPGFFVQMRVGRGGMPFACLKLRTMKPDAEEALTRLIASDAEVAAEWAQHQKLSRDPRITRVGAFLRKTSLDELPQFFNVLAGHMSFVGPRPFMTDQADLYLSSGGQGYFDLRPGITGPWQVEARDCSTFPTRVRYDEAYWRSLSLLGDVRLLCQTVGVVLRMTGR